MRFTLHGGDEGQAVPLSEALERLEADSGLFVFETGADPHGLKAMARGIEEVEEPGAILRATPPPQRASCEGDAWRVHAHAAHVAFAAARHVPAHSHLRRPTKSS